AAAARPHLPLRDERPMKATKLQVKIFADNLRLEDLESFVPVFHRWLRDNVRDERVIDVADYPHVPGGPGVLLVRPGADCQGGLAAARPGLLYSRTRALPEGAELVDDALRRALKATELLAAAAELPVKPVFSTQEILIRVPDRLHIQSDEASFDGVRGELTAAL